MPESTPQPERAKVLAAKPEMPTWTYANELDGLARQYENVPVGATDAETARLQEIAAAMRNAEATFALERAAQVAATLEEMQVAATATVAKRFAA